MITVPPPDASADPAVWAEFYRLAAVARLLAAVDPARPGPRPTAFAAVYREQLELHALHRLLRARALTAAAEDERPGVVARVEALAARLAAEGHDGPAALPIPIPGRTPLLTTEGAS